MARYLLGFWAFTVSPKYRTAVLSRWRSAGSGIRTLMLIEGLVATMVGLGVPLLIAWLLLPLL